MSIAYHRVSQMVNVLGNFSNVNSKVNMTRPNRVLSKKKQLHKQIKSNYNMNVNEMKTHDYKYYGREERGFKIITLNYIDKEEVLTSIVFFHEYSTDN